MEYTKIKEIYGVYFRVNREGKWLNLCFTDLTVDEQKNILQDKETMFLKNLCLRLAAIIRRSE